MGCHMAKITVMMAMMSIEVLASHIYFMPSEEQLIVCPTIFLT